MDWTVIERMWTQAKGRIQSKWDKLTREARDFYQPE
jgi:hypothetical protein